MAADSLFGGDYEKFSPETQQLLDSVFADTVNGKIDKIHLSGGATFFLATGAGGVKQGAVVSDDGSAISVEIQDGSLSIALALPANVEMVYRGPGEVQTTTEATNWLQSFVDQALPAGTGNPAVDAARDMLFGAIDAILKSVGERGGVKDVSLRLVALNDGSTESPAKAIGADEVLFEGTSSNKEILTFFMHELGTDKTLVLKAVSAALALGEGKVRVEGSEGAMVSGDLFAQTIVGGMGNDTLVGGGGNDTLTGGNGHDTFGFVNFNGHVTITDFDVTTDTLTFALEGINNVADLARHFTGLTVDEAGSSTLHFANDALTVTLVGVSAETLTVDLMKFEF